MGFCNLHGYSETRLKTTEKGGGEGGSINYQTKPKAKEAL